MTLPAWERLAPIGTRSPAEIMADVAELHRREIEAEKRVASWPPPEVYARPITVLPRGPAKFAAMCDSWRATAARGPTGTNEAPGWRMADSICLRGEVGQRRFVALWLEKPGLSAAGKKQLGLLFAYAHGLEGRVNTATLGRYLSQDDGLPWIPTVGFISRTTH